ncbi:MAG: phage major capsid protein [Chloroflexi bacterium]|nr:MAG: phage major capsid protein [Chloroflexota bacterium]
MTPRQWTPEQQARWDRHIRELTPEQRAWSDRVLRGQGRPGPTIRSAANLDVPNKKERAALAMLHGSSRAVVDQYKREQATTGLAEVEYRAAFTSYLKGEAGELEENYLRAHESRDLGVATGAAGAYLVPASFLAKFTSRQVYADSVRAVANVITTTSGSDLTWPANDDTGNSAAILGENVATGNTDLVLNQRTLHSFEYSAPLGNVSWQLLKDAAFDLEGLLAERSAQRLARAQVAHFTTGTGSGQPVGFTSVFTTGVTLPTGFTTTFSLNGLIDLTASVDEAYRRNASWMMSDAAWTAIQKMTDGTRPLWVPSTTPGEPHTLLGYPVYINNSIPVPAANAASVYWGDWRRGYIVRDAAGGLRVIRLNERRAELLQSQFLAFLRSDGNVDDTQAVKSLKHSAT